MERYVLFNISISVASLVKKNKEDKYYSKSVYEKFLFIHGKNMKEKMKTRVGHKPNICQN